MKPTVLLLGAAAAIGLLLAGGKGGGAGGGGTAAPVNTQVDKLLAEPHTPEDLEAAAVILEQAGFTTQATRVRRLAGSKIRGDKKSVRGTLLGKLHGTG